MLPLATPIHREGDCHGRLLSLKLKHWKIILSCGYELIYILFLYKRSNVPIALGSTSVLQYFYRTRIKLKPGRIWP